MASPYVFDDDEDQEQQPPERPDEKRTRMLLNQRTYHMITTRSRRLGISTPAVAATHALSVWYALTNYLLMGGELMVRDGIEIRQLVIEHPDRKGEPLVPRPIPPEGVFWLGDFQGDDNEWWFRARQRGDAN